MKNHKEKRILVLEVNPDCRNLRVALGDEDGMYCVQPGRSMRITEKDCAKCKDPVLLGISRSEAIERMAKIIFRELESCLKPFHKVPKEKRGCIATAAEAALDALLGKEAKNEI